ncbi:hypothetical protein ABKV19_027219 [Rosa sericea]
MSQEDLDSSFGGFIECGAVQLNELFLHCQVARSAFGKVRLKAGIGRIYRSSSLILVEQDSEQITIVAQGWVIEAEDIYGSYLFLCP